jgi:hypothetical protein
VQKMSLFDDKYKFIKGNITNKRGQYSFEVECGETYYVRAEKRNYETKEGLFLLKNKWRKLFVS